RPICGRRFPTQLPTAQSVTADLPFLARRQPARAVLRRPGGSWPLLPGGSRWSVTMEAPPSLEQRLISRSTHVFRRGIEIADRGHNWYAWQTTAQAEPTLAILRLAGWPSGYSTYTPTFRGGM